MAGLAGLAAVGLIILLARITDVGSTWVYGGSLVAFAALSVIAVVGSIVPGFTARMLGWSPLVWVGRISYGLYLVHWPIIVWLNEERLGFGGAALFAVQMSATAVVAVLSYRMIEMPIRERRVLRRPGIAGFTFVAAAVGTFAVSMTVLSTVEATPDSKVEVLTTLPRASTIAPVPSDGVFDGSGPINILVIGDSTAENIARGLADVGDPEIGVISGGVLGCPLLPAMRVRDSVVGEQDVTYCPDVEKLVLESAPNVDVVLVVVGLANQWDYLPIGGDEWIDSSDSSVGRTMVVGWRRPVRRLVERSVWRGRANRATRWSTPRPRVRAGTRTHLADPANSFGVGRGSKLAQLTVTLRVCQPVAPSGATLVTSSVWV
ncbi:MAG: acyltransferase [Actinobacteria bacterium]|nr:acyltransferase [Actinomycetota bacterium]